MLLSTPKFEAKAQEVFKEGLQGTPKYVKLEKKLGGAEHKKVVLQDPSGEEGGMMLYTSGTTNRPASLYQG